MADLLALLSQAASSLATHRADAATASHNLANANTPGYARQRAELEAVSPADRVGGAAIGRGVTLTTVSQARDRFIEAQMPAALGQASRSSVLSSSLQSVTVFNPETGAGLSAALGGFYGAMRQLSQNPGDLGLRQAAVASGQGLALAFNRAGQGLASARAGFDTQLQASADEVNGLAQRMATLNKQIAIERAGGGAPNDLLDARQSAQDRLAQLTGAVPLTDAQGNVNMALPGGTSLVTADRAAKLSTLPDTANGGHLALQIQSADGAPPAALPTRAMSGAMGGMLDARDGALKTAQRNLDTLAFDLGNAINTMHRAGVGLDGVGNRDFYNVGTSADGAATRIEVQPVVLGEPRLFAASASSAGLPGDGRNLLRLVATESQALSTGADAVGALASAVGQFGAATRTALDAHEGDTAVMNQLQQVRESASGVSIDEEMVKLTAAQRAFEAVTRVITTSDEMLQTLLKIK